MEHHDSGYDSEPTINTTKLHHDWRDQLLRDGHVVIKKVIGETQAGHYVESLLDWLETFPYGFSKNDQTTWGAQHLPSHVKGGMYHGYAVSHERFFWQARTEPGVLKAFEKLWGTDELLVSFDGVNLTLPAEDRAKPEFWPHVDQSPLRKGLQCVQGILNLTPNGPRDGGLIVLKGSSSLNERFFQTHKTTNETWGPPDWYGFTAEEVAWFTTNGCEAVKVCAEPGDLILWDSRTVHYNTLPETSAIRSVLYICYTPASYACEKDRQTKARLFNERTGTTHWPHANIFPNDQKQCRLGLAETFQRSRPVHEPEETGQVLRLAGVEKYP